MLLNDETQEILWSNTQAYASLGAESSENFRHAANTDVCDPMTYSY